MHYYQFNIGDYKSHTSHLTVIEDIAYRRLLDMYYLHEKPLDNSIPAVARLIGMRDYEAEVEMVLLEFFVCQDEGGWINPRADKEIAVYKGFSDAGKRGAAKRWGTDGNDHPIAPPIANNKHKPLTTKHKPTIKPLSEYSDEFIRFWNDYPKKVGKDKAWQLWKKLKPNLADVLKALSWQRTTEQWINNFIPNPETYLNQGRWKDEPQTSANGNKPWYMTSTGIEAKAKEKGLSIGRDESIPAFLKRVKVSEGITL